LGRYRHAKGLPTGSLCCQYCVLVQTVSTLF
jgi:hypothetical protein